MVAHRPLSIPIPLVLCNRHGLLNHYFTTFLPLFGNVGIGMSSFGSPPVGSYLLPIDTYGQSPTVFELFSWLQKRFRPPDRLSVRPRYDDEDRSRSYSFVERQKC